jgi:hypothetical protein
MMAGGAHAASIAVSAIMVVVTHAMRRLPTHPDGSAWRGYRPHLSGPDHAG